MNQGGDPERLTDDKDWIAHVNASEVSERREDGLCIDTLTGSTKIRRKASTVLIPNSSVSEIPGASDAVLQSVQKLEVRVKSPKNNPANKHNGYEKTPVVELHALTGQKSPPNEETQTVPPPRNSPDLQVVQRTEYTWDTLLSQPSDVRKKRSQSFNRDFPEYRDQNMSLRFNKDVEGKRFVRSKSLRGYTQRELAILSAEEIQPVTKLVISVKREGENKKRKSSRKSLKDQRAVINAGNEKSTKDKTAQKSEKITRSGSAPSIRAKEKIVKSEAEDRRRRAHSFIPEPDYQSVSIEELVSAAQQQDQVTSEDQVCIVEIHNVPTDRDSNASWSAGNNTQMVDESPSSPSQQPRSPREEENHYSTIVDIGGTSPVPGVAVRMTTVLNDDDQNTEENEIPTGDTRERKLSVKNRVQNFEAQISNGPPIARHSQTKTSESNYVIETTVSSTSDINNNVKTLPNLRQTPSVSAPRIEANAHNIPNGHPAFTTKPSEVRSIGKLTIVRNVEKPYNQIRDNPPKGAEKDSSTNVRQSTNSISIGNGSIPHPPRTTEEPKHKDSSPLPPPVPYTIHPRSSSQTLDNTRTIISSKDDQKKSSPPPQLTSAEILQRALQKSAKGNAVNAPTTTTREADTDLTMEEKKRNWKREQIEDQLHNARIRNENQHYIFGTGLAYQSCMPELQNRLKQLTLAK